MGTPDQTRLLSKTEFKKGLECPRRLAYARERYPSTAKDNPYLEFLADGGFMVEAIARALFPGGQEVDQREGESPADATRRMLGAAESVDLFEADFEFDGCSARVDILSRRGTVIELIEIKAKSFDSSENRQSPFRGKRGGIDSAWKPYLLDVAFQTRIVRGALGPGFKVIPKLCLVDTAKRCNGDAIYSKIELLPASKSRFGMPRARYLGDPAALREDHFLGFQDAASEVEELLADASPAGMEMSRVGLAVAARAGSLRQLPIDLGVKCRDCEYRTVSPPKPDQDGFRECWGALAEGHPHVLDLFRIDLLAGRDGRGIRALLDRGISSVGAIPDDAITSDSDTAERQRVQVRSVRTGDEWRGPGLVPALAGLHGPFHFVDFETSRMAVPYHAGMPPYGQVAFQFSCHTLARPDATELVHKEWINTKDRWPNVKFAQALRDAIGDGGHMLVWSDHERSALREIAEQIRVEGHGPPDLADWLDPLTKPHDEGGRTVDLYDICRRHYYHPAMGGKTSIKAVLKAIWQANRTLHDHPWFKGYLREKDGKVLSPYEALPDIPVAEGGVTAVRDGTGAMRAYQDMVYGLRGSDEKYKQGCCDALLQYCKLDTLAMVMVWVHWASVDLRTSGAGSQVEEAR